MCLLILFYRPDKMLWSIPQYFISSTTDVSYLPTKLVWLSIVPSISFLVSKMKQNTKLQESWSASLFPHIHSGFYI